MGWERAVCTVRLILESFVVKLRFCQANSASNHDWLVYLDVLIASLFWLILLNQSFLGWKQFA